MLTSEPEQNKKEIGATGMEELALPNLPSITRELPILAYPSCEQITLASVLRVKKLERVPHEFP
jgi:hypothetical protein